jgi:hypothetical protein
LWFDLPFLGSADRPDFRSMPAACQFFLFADETVSNTIPLEIHMARGIAMTTDTCRQPGDGAAFRAHAIG